MGLPVAPPARPLARLALALAVKVYAERKEVLGEGEAVGQAERVGEGQGVGVLASHLLPVGLAVAAGVGETLALMVGAVQGVEEAQRVAGAGLAVPASPAHVPDTLALATMEGEFEGLAETLGLPRGEGVVEGLREDARVLVLVRELHGLPEKLEEVLEVREREGEGEGVREGGREEEGVP